MHAASPAAALVSIGGRAALVRWYLREHISRLITHTKPQGRREDTHPARQHVRKRLERESDNESSSQGIIAEIPEREGVFRWDPRAGVVRGARLG